MGDFIHGSHHSKTGPGPPTIVLPIRVNFNSPTYAPVRLWLLVTRVGLRASTPNDTRTDCNEFDSEIKKKTVSIRTGLQGRSGMAEKSRPASALCTSIVEHGLKGRHFPAQWSTRFDLNWTRSLQIPGTFCLAPSGNRRYHGMSPWKAVVDRGSR